MFAKIAIVTCFIGLAYAGALQNPNLNGLGPYGGYGSYGGYGGYSGYPGVNPGGVATSYVTFNKHLGIRGPSSGYLGAYGLGAGIGSLPYAGANRLGAPGYGVHGNGYGAYDSGYGAYGSGYAAYDNGYGAYEHGYGAYGNGYGPHANSYGAPANVW